MYNSDSRCDTVTFMSCFAQIGQRAVIVGNSHHSLWSIRGTPNNTSGNSLATILQSTDNLCLATPQGFTTYIHQSTGRESVLDLCFVTANLVSEIEVTKGPCLGSDHLPIEQTLNLAPDIQIIKFRKKYKLKDVCWNKWRSGLPDFEYNDLTDWNMSNSQLAEAIKSSKYQKPVEYTTLNITNHGGLQSVQD